MNKSSVGIISLPKSRVYQHIAIAGIVAAVAFLALLIPSHQAEAALMDRVNEALRSGGMSVTAANSNPFQECITKKHYSTFAGLVDGIKYNLAQGTLPDCSGLATPAVAPSCVTGDVTSLSFNSTTGTGNVTIFGDMPYDDGNIPTDKTLSIKANQNTLATAGKGIGTGTADVTACWVASDVTALYGHLTVN
jgi:hypothetical protein